MDDLEVHFPPDGNTINGDSNNKIKNEAGKSIISDDEITATTATTTTAIASIVRNNVKSENSDGAGIMLNSLIKNLKPGESSNNVDEERPHQCKLCDEEFMKESNLELHMSIHSGQRSCPVCEKQFTKKVYLKRHLSVHTREKRFKCEVCFKGFADQRYLNRHLTIHARDSILNYSMLLSKDFGPKKKRRKIPASEKPFQCDTCNKGFLNECTLKAHIAIHTGKTPYKCEECQKGFINSSHLKYHLSKHTGEKEFACGVCGMTFSQSSNLKRHIRTNHKPDGML